MANDLKIKITSTLDQTSSINEINKAINRIEKDSSLKKLNINIGITDDQINKVVRQIAQIQDKLKSAKSPTLIPDKEDAKIKSFVSNVKTAVDYYKELGSVKVSQNLDLDPNTQKAKNFTLTITKATGEVEKLKYVLSSLKGIQGAGEYALVGRTLTDNSQATLERQLQQEQSINRTIEQRRQSLQNQLQLYQRTAEIQANSLRNNSNKILSEGQQSALNNYLNSVRALNVNTPQLQQRMKELSLDFRNVSSQAETAGRMNMTFGQSLQTAMEKFPINLYRWE